MFRKLIVLATLPALLGAPAPAAPSASSELATVAQTLPGPGACQTPVHVSGRVWETRLRQKVDALAEGFPPLVPMQALRASPLGDLRSATQGRAADARPDPERERAVRLLWLRVRYHYDAAGHGSEAGKSWSVQDLDVILAALHDFPDNALPFDDDYRVISDERGADSVLQSAASPLPGGHVVAFQQASAGAILLGEGWHRLPEAEQRGTVFHELAHDFAATRARIADWREPWRVAAASDAATALKRGQATSYVSRYAQTSLDEDMAESAVAYRYRPELLKARAPAKYEFLRQWMFDGLQYGSAGECLDPSALSEAAAVGAYAILDHGWPPPEEVRQHIYDCAGDPMFRVYAMSKDQCWLLRSYRDAFLAAWREKASADWATAPAAFAGNTYFLTDHLARLAPEIRAQVLARHQQAMADDPQMGE